MARDDENSTEAIDLLLTDDERANLEYAASFQQKSVSAFVVEAALCAARAMLA
jgi:uncharacterized protein (DUF1778 family)